LYSAADLFCWCSSDEARRWSRRWTREQAEQFVKDTVRPILEQLQPGTPLADAILKRCFRGLLRTARRVA